MIVTIWRHGEAGQAADDRQRQLTTSGERDVKAGAQALAAICSRRSMPEPDALWYSRWHRTAQTAELVGAAWEGLAGRSEDALIPGAMPEAVERALEPLWLASAPPQHLVLVSHQPLVSQLADFFTGERGVIPSIPPGGMVVLSMDSPAAVGAGLLFWAFPPVYEACT